MFQIFANDDPKHPNPSPRWVERRRHPRFQKIREVEICRDGVVYPATTFAISESGMSAAAPILFRVGAVVKISPIVGKTVKAIVRWRVGTLYGFEFLGLTDQQKEDLCQLCEQLLLFQFFSYSPSLGWFKPVTSLKILLSTCPYKCLLLMYESVQCSRFRSGAILFHQQNTTTFNHGRQAVRVTTVLSAKFNKFR